MNKLLMLLVWCIFFKIASVATDPKKIFAEKVYSGNLEIEENLKKYDSAAPAEKQILRKIILDQVDEIKKDYNEFKDKYPESYEKSKASVDFLVKTLDSKVEQGGIIKTGFETFKSSLSSFVEKFKKFSLWDFIFDEKNPYDEFDDKYGELVDKVLDEMVEEGLKPEFASEVGLRLSDIYGDYYYHQKKLGENVTDEDFLSYFKNKLTAMQRSEKSDPKVVRAMEKLQNKIEEKDQEQAQTKERQVQYDENVIGDQIEGLSPNKLSDLQAKVEGLEKAILLDGKAYVKLEGKYQEIDTSTGELKEPEDEDAVSNRIENDEGESVHLSDLGI